MILAIYVKVVRVIVGASVVVVVVVDVDVAIVLAHCWPNLVGPEV